MNGTIKLPDLIEEIYDAALEPALWNDVIVSINDFIGSRACGLVEKDLINHCGRTLYYHGVDPHYIQLYSESYSRFDPLVSLPAFGQVVGIPDLIDYDEYRRGPFYQDWLRPQRVSTSQTPYSKNQIRVARFFWRFFRAPTCSTTKCGGALRRSHRMSTAR